MPGRFVGSTRRRRRVAGRRVPIHALAVGLAVVSTACLAASRSSSWSAWAASVGMLVTMTVAMAPTISPAIGAASAGALFAVAAVAARWGRDDPMARHRAFGALAMAGLVLLHVLHRAASPATADSAHGHAAATEFTPIVALVIAGGYTAYSVVVAVDLRTRRPRGRRHPAPLGEVAAMALGSLAMAGPLGV